MRTANRPAHCPKCGAAAMKRYPDEFEVPPSRWMRWLGGAKAQLGGAPEPSEGVWVCTKCGHNMG